jgi:hypothetical protein
MGSSSVKSLALVVGIAALGFGAQAAPASAQGTMPPGSYTCRPLSEENFLPPPPIGSPEVMTPEEQAFADASKLPPDLCPPGMIAYPVPSLDYGPHPQAPPTGTPQDAPEPADSSAEKSKAKKAKALRKKAKAKALRKKARAKKRRLAKARRASRH